MLKRLRNLSDLNGKKRYIVLGLLTLELMSLPAAAKIVQSVNFDPAPNVIAVEIPSGKTGLSRFLVASDAGFIVEVDTPIGDVEVDIYVSGKMGNSVEFGVSAQLPGPQTICASALARNSDIYHATHATAAKEGSAPERAIVMEFQYAAEAHPKFRFIAGEKPNLGLTPCNETHI